MFDVVSRPASPVDGLRIAVVHDWLVNYAGSERVVAQFLKVLPQADLFSLIDFLPQNERGFIQNKPVETSFIQKLPFAKAKYRHYLPLMPLAIEQFDLSSYDIVISSSHAVAKGVIVGPDQLHISYVHSPMRYAWDLQHQYLEESGLATGPLNWPARYLLHRLRLWDTRTSNGVDEFIANSGFVARRIKKTYGREASVIYPPVDTSAFTLRAQKEEFYLTASRLVPYKRVDLIAEAFAKMPDRELVVIGGGPELETLRRSGLPNVRLLGHQPFDALRAYMQRARAFIFAAEEDFGIVPVEAQACGTPVIAYGKGGALETVRGLDSERPTGVFFSSQEPDAIVRAVECFEAASTRFSPEEVRENALRFSSDRFRNELRAFVAEKWEIFSTQKARG